jgi:cobalt transporter subunit CbtB
MQSVRNEATGLNVSVRAGTIPKVFQLVAAFALGGIIVFGAGFLNTAAVHNAAHDTRHSQGFPCH